MDSARKLFFGLQEHLIMHNGWQNILMMDPVINLLPVILLLNQHVAKVAELNRLRAQRRRRRGRK